MVTSIFPPQIGGPSRQVWDLVQFLRKRTKMKPIVVTFGKEYGRIIETGVPIYRVKLWSSLPSVLGTFMRQVGYFICLMGVIKKEQIDFIHCHDIRVLGLVSGITARLFNKPSVIKYPGDAVYENLNRDTLRVKDIAESFNYNMATKLHMLFEKMVFRLHRKIWAVSRFQSSVLEKELNIPRAKVILMPNYIDIGRYKRPRLASHGGQKRVLVVSRFVPWKQIDKIDRIIDNLSFLPINFCIAGGGNKDIEEEIRKLARKYRGKQKLNFLGSISPRKIYKEFAKADIYLSLACYEPFSVALIEAQAAGLPAVVARVSGIPEIVKDGETGFLYEEGNWREAAEKISRLITDEQLYKKMIHKAHKRAKEYDINGKLSVITGFYQQVARHKNVF